MRESGATSRCLSNQGKTNLVLWLERQVSAAATRAAVLATSGLSVGPLGSYLVDSTASVIGDRFGGQATPTSLATPH